MNSTNISIRKYDDGKIEHYKDGVLHNESGPAIEYPNGDEIWCIDGRFHRFNGPAINLVSSGIYEYYLNGMSSEKLYYDKINPNLPEINITISSSVDLGLGKSTLAEYIRTFLSDDGFLCENTDKDIKYLDGHNIYSTITEISKKIKIIIKT